ncbi:MAG: surface carbohydrate biosynthesis protein [Desulfopila sp.]
MKKNGVSLLIPVENQVRELDPKLLLACVAARRGFPSIIGPRREMHLKIATFPRGVYLSKSLTSSSFKIFRIMQMLGHEIVAWDEEALVHPPPATYFTRRLSPLAIKYVSHLFAWGQENAELWRLYPDMPAELPIHITGNPRGDLLRPGLRSFYGQEVEGLRRAHGDFILINTNYNHVNGFYPILNLFVSETPAGEDPRFGRAAKGMSYEYAEGLRAHKQANFEQMKKLIPQLEQAFPDHTIVVRPHPTENQQVYHDIAARATRVTVTNEGNVIPWLLASRVLIHNCCTTGVEAYALGVPAITYRAYVDEEYDLGFYRLPNLLSHQAFDFTELQALVGKILAGEEDGAGDQERDRLLDGYLSARTGPLACERMVDVLEQALAGRTELPEPPWAKRMNGLYKTRIRRIKKWFRASQKGSHNRPEFQRHRYPGISLEELQQRLQRFTEGLEPGAELSAEQLAANFYRISAR